MDKGKKIRSIHTHMKEIRGKSEKDLQKMLVEKQLALRAFRFGVSGSKVRNQKEGRTIKRTIAKIKTEQNTMKRALTQKVA